MLHSSLKAQEKKNNKDRKEIKNWTEINQSEPYPVSCVLSPSWVFYIPANWLITIIILFTIVYCGIMLTFYTKISLCLWKIGLRQMILDENGEGYSFYEIMGKILYNIITTCKEFEWWLKVIKSVPTGSKTLGKKYTFRWVEPKRKISHYWGNKAY